MHAQKQGYRANALPNKKHTIAQKRYWQDVNTSI